MAKNTVNKYVWLVETIYKAKKISFEEIRKIVPNSGAKIQLFFNYTKCVTQNV